MARPRHLVKAKRQLVARLEAELLRRVRARGGLSRVELARELHLVPSTAGIYVSRLVREGYLIETQKVASAPGRPATRVEPNPDRGQFVGVDFEARNIMAIAVDFSERPLKRSHREIGRGDTVETVLGKIEDSIREVSGGQSHPLLGIGVGVPGTIDSTGALALDYAFLPGWRNVPLADRLRARFGVPAHLENNIRSMALAELWFGAGRGLRNFVCIGVRTGIAAGVVAQGQLFLGAQNLAGEIGKWPVAFGPNAVRKAGDSAATLESVASLPAILEAASAAAGRSMTFEGLKQFVTAGDPGVLRALTPMGQVHGRVAAQLALLLDPERIILVGPLAELGEAFLKPLRAELMRVAGSSAPGFVSSTLGGFSGALGAAALALHQWKPAR